MCVCACFLSFIIYVSVSLCLSRSHTVNYSLALPLSLPLPLSNSHTHTHTLPSCPRSHENSQTSPCNSCPKITSLAKSPSTNPLQNSISYLQTLVKPLNPLTFANFSPSNYPGLLAHHHICPYLALQSHFL